MLVGFCSTIGKIDLVSKMNHDSCNQLFVCSWVRVGDAATGLIQGHRSSLTYCESDSPFFEFLKLTDGRLLLTFAIRSNSYDGHALDL